MHTIARAWREAPLSAGNAALCELAEKLTHTPQKMSEADVQAMRDAGHDDPAIHDAVQVIGYFNYINRVADALGIEPEGFIRPWGEE